METKDIKTRKYNNNSQNSSSGHIALSKSIAKTNEQPLAKGESVGSNPTSDAIFIDKISNLIIKRVWSMPNKRTFTIKPIKELIEKYKTKGLLLDPFPYPYKEDCLDYLKRYEDSSADVVLFDPPYSPRQLKECYDNQGMVLHDTKSSVWANWKDEIAKKIRVGGLCLSFGWSTNGLGKNRGFEIIEILLVAHGGNHNDTIITIERKVSLLA